MGDTLRTFYRLRRMKVDAVIDFEFFSKYTMVLSYLTGAPIRVGFKFPTIYRGNLLTHPTYYNHYRHTAEIFLALAEQLGANHALPVHPRLQALAEGRSTADELLRRHGLAESGRFAVINPTVGEVGADKRRWVPERFAELARRLLDEQGLQVVFIGTQADRTDVDRLIADAGLTSQVHNVAGETDIACLAGVMERATVLIGCDSGPAHLAICLDTPTVTLFGTETPVLFGPTRGNHRVIYNNLYCSPCLMVYNYKVSDCHNDQKCMKLITVDEVYQAVQEVLAAEAATGRTAS